MTKPHPFQAEDSRRLARRFKGRGYLSWEPGLGKSLGALLTLHKHLKVGPIIVVCPASVKFVWQRECRKHFGLRAVVLEGTTPPIDGGFPLHARLVVINYDILGPWLKWLLKLKPKAVVLDEAHSVANRYAARSRYCRRLCRGVPHLLLLSGTPLVNRPVELWNQMNLLNPAKFSSYWNWVRAWCAPRRTPWGWNVNGASNLPALRKLLRRNGVLRRRKADVLDQLPAKQRTVVPVELSRPKEYRRAVKDFLGWLGERKPDKVVKAAKAEQIVKLGVLKQLASKLSMRSKLAWIADFLKNSDQKLIVFAVHRRVIRRVVCRFGEGRTARVDGSVTGKKRQLAFDRFLTDPKCRLFVGNVRAAGVGWSAKGVSNVAFLELPWSPGLVIQAEDRCHGINRGEAGKRVQVFFLVAKGTIESKLARIIQTKQRVLSEAMDGKGKGDRLDVFDLLERELKKEAKGATVSDRDCW